VLLRGILKRWAFKLGELEITFDNHLPGSSFATRDFGGGSLLSFPASPCLKGVLTPSGLHPRQIFSNHRSVLLSMVVVHWL